jgi:hypothetical protein
MATAASGVETMSRMSTKACCLTLVQQVLVAWSLCLVTVLRLFTRASSTHASTSPAHSEIILLHRSEGFVNTTAPSARGSAPLSPSSTISPGVMVSRVSSPGLGRDTKMWLTTPYASAGGTILLIFRRCSLSSAISWPAVAMPVKMERMFMATPLEWPFSSEQLFLDATLWA